MMEIKNKVVLFQATPCTITWIVFQLYYLIWMHEIYYLKDEPFQKEG